MKSFLESQAHLPFTYEAIGATQTGHIPADYRHDVTKEIIGHGQADFEKAKLAAESWQMFPRTWTRIFPEKAAIKSGNVVAMAAVFFGIWWKNSCRIVYTLDEPRRFGFAYGTLPGHMAKGEELFLVSLEDDGSVTYTIDAFSRPRHLLTILGLPALRMLQRRFRRDSATQMRSFVQS